MQLENKLSITLNNKEIDALLYALGHYKPKPSKIHTDSEVNERKSIVDHLYYRILKQMAYDKDGFNTRLIK